MRMPRFWIVALIAALAAFACGPSPQELEADREAIRDTLEAYLPKLAEAYATGNIEVLRGLTVEKELAKLSKMIGDLAGQGRVFRPELRELTVESVTVFQHDNAYVTTLEVWDVHLYAAGSDRLLGESLSEATRVKYQMKRRREGWQILFRQRLKGPGEETEAPSLQVEEAPSRPIENPTE